MRRPEKASSAISSLKRTVEAIGSSSEPVSLPINLLDDHPMNEELFGEITDENTSNLQEAIKAHGFLGAIWVWKGEGGRYTIFSGHRRKHAMQALGNSRIPAVVVDKPSKDPEQRLMYLEANIVSRGSIGAQEKHIYIAKQIKYAEEAILQLRGTEGMEGRTRDLVAELFGTTHSTIQRYRALLSCTESILALEDEGLITLRAAAEASALPPEKQDALSAKIRKIDFSATPGERTELVSGMIKEAKGTKVKSISKNKTAFDLYTSEINSISRRWDRSPITDPAETEAILKLLKEIIHKIESAHGRS